MHSRRPIVLITGFGPFPGQPRNASSLLAEAVAAEAQSLVPGYAFKAATLPTEWETGPRVLGALLVELEPVIALHFGVSSRATGFVVETRARNERSPTPDACGAAPADCQVDIYGPDALSASLPARLIVDRLRRRGLPAQLSRDAGAYLCNAVLYHSLADARRRSANGAGAGLRRGFVHLPDRLLAGPGTSARRAAPSRLDWEGAVAGGLEIVSVCAGIAGCAGRSSRTASNYA
jgi:pyroglutamyl-peptidase